MSVAYLTTQELSCFAALIVKLDLGSLENACRLSELISIGNAAAFTAQYNEYAEASTADEIERDALAYLAGRDGFDIVHDHFGPCAYNMIANDGRAFDGAFSEIPQDAPLLDTVRQIEKLCHAWQDKQRAERQRREENDAAFLDVGPLPTITREDLQAKLEQLGMDRVIVASYHVDESDSQTDYFGGRRVREVVIGFGKGKRENFSQLRKAAALFPPTEDFGPGFDRWTVTANKRPDEPDRWSFGEQLRDDRYRVREFRTQAEAEAAVAEIIATAPECQPDYTGCIGFPALAQAYGFACHRHSIEQRENYSMGGGNYLGERYSGWKVTSYVGAPRCDAIEFFEPPRKARKRPDKPVPTPEQPQPIEIDNSACDYLAWL